MKVCSKCKLPKEESEFYKHKGNVGGLAHSCKLCDNRRRTAAKIEKRRILGVPSRRPMSYGVHGNKDSPDYGRSVQLKHCYGITISDYNQIFDNQKGCCAICEKHQSEFQHRLSVDHDHKTGKVRKLLCHNCNHGLGNFFDSTELLLKAIQYLK